MERLTVRYEMALLELAERAELQPLQGPAGMYAVHRLQALVQQLRTVYDHYELEGDVAPVRREIEAYQDDLHAHQLRPDSWVTAYLTRFVADLELPSPPSWTIETRAAAPAWPSGILAISPQDLQALHQEQQTRARQP